MLPSGVAGLGNSDVFLPRSSGAASFSSFISISIYLVEDDSELSGMVPGLATSNITVPLEGCSQTLRITRPQGYPGLWRQVAVAGATAACSAVDGAERAIKEMKVLGVRFGPVVAGQAASLSLSGHRWRTDAVP